MLKVKHIIKGKSFRWSFLICLIFSLAIIPLSSLLAAFAVNMTDDPTANIAVSSLMAMIISAIVSGIFTSLYKKDCSVGYAASVALCSTVIIMIIGIIINRGRLLSRDNLYIGISYQAEKSAQEAQKIKTSELFRRFFFISLISLCNKAAPARSLRRRYGGSHPA